MLKAPVPDFFQEDDEPALRAQVGWVEENFGLPDSFFAAVLRTEETTIHAWRRGELSLPEDQQLNLQALWYTFMRILSFAGNDERRVRAFLEFRAPNSPDDRRSPIAPPWCGSTLRHYMEEH